MEFDVSMLDGLRHITQYSTPKIPSAAAGTCPAQVPCRQESRFSTSADFQPTFFYFYINYELLTTYFWNSKIKISNKTTNDKYCIHHSQFCQIPSYVIWREFLLDFSVTFSQYPSKIGPDKSLVQSVVGRRQVPRSERAVHTSSLTAVESSLKLEVLVVHTFQRNVACSRIMSRKDVGGIWHLARLMGGQGNRLHWSRDKAMPTFRCVSLSLVLCL